MVKKEFVKFKNSQYILKVNNQTFYLVYFKGMKDITSKSDIISTAPKYLFAGIYVDIFCYFVIALVIYGSYLLYLDIQFLKAEALPMITSNFMFYEYSSLYQAVLFFVFFVFVHIIFRYVFSGFFQKLLRKKYKEESQEIQLAYLYKVNTNFFKFCYFVIVTVMGFYTLYDMEYFLDYRGGSENLRNFYSKGIPYIYEMPNKDSISFYYNFNLGFVIFEMYLLLIQHLQSDFLMMVIHHLATMSLVVFSYSSNTTAIGSIILLILYFGDVFSTFLRIVIYLDVPDYIPAASAFSFLGVFAYTRLVVFSELIVSGYAYSPRKGIAENCLYGFLTLILILSIVWIIMITKKVLIFCKTGRIEDIYKVKVNLPTKRSS